jgi:molecular chaperone GrpE
MSRKSKKHKDAKAERADGATESPDQDIEACEADPDETADLIDQLQRERDEFESKYLHALAEAQNTLRRSRLNEREATRQGADAVVRSVIPVLDHFDLALGHDAAGSTAEQIIEGVRVIRDELMKALSAQGVGVIDPKKNDEFDPNQHEAMLQQPDPDTDPGCIVSTYQVGYTLGDRVIRPAKVIVCPTEQVPQETGPSSEEPSDADV